MECSIAYFDNLDFKLLSGAKLKNLKIAFKTFGELNKEKTNAILICHALTGDQFATDIARSEDAIIDPTVIFGVPVNPADVPVVF